MSDTKSKDPPSKTNVGVTVATPCFGGMLSEGYFHSILKASAAFEKMSPWVNKYPPISMGYIN